MLAGCLRVAFLKALRSSCEVLERRRHRISCYAFVILVSTALIMCTQLTQPPPRPAQRVRTGEHRSRHGSGAPNATLPQLQPGQFLFEGDALATGAFTAVLSGSRICHVGTDGLAIDACWGEHAARPNGLPSFMAHQQDHFLCVYWGTPSKNEGKAWCEGLPLCPKSQPMKIVLDGSSGQLAGKCGSRRVWPAILPMPALISEDHQPALLVFQGIAHKGANGPILSTQRTLHNRIPQEYRVTSFTWHIDYTQGLRAGERVESDVCLTIFSSQKETSLESGEELFCTHEQFVQSTASQLPVNSSNQFVFGGFPLFQGKRVNVAGVSNIFPTISEDEYRRRLFENPEFLALHFRVTVARVHSASQKPLTTVRSPLRDRSFSMSRTRPVAPHTDFRNTGSKPVKLCGIGTFLSAIKYRGQVDLLLRAYINNRLVLEQVLPSQQLLRSAASSTQIIPLDATLWPSEVFSAQVHVIVNGVGIFDAAVFIFTDAPLGWLQPSSEMQLWPGKIDLNLDGAPDNVDYTDDGEVWAELTKVHCKGCPGAHDTQFRWGVGLPWSHAEFRKLARLPANFGNERDKAYIVIDNVTSRHCIQLRRVSADSTAAFGLRTCGGGGFSPGSFGYHADFDGDGYVDRVRMSLEQTNEAPFGRAWLSLGGPGGLRQEKEWVTFVQKVVHHDIELSHELKRHVLHTEQWEPYGVGAVYMICPPGRSVATHAVKQPSDMLQVCV